jgi:hypothetical protein
MGSVLPLVGIAVLMVFGFVVAITALSYDPRAKFDRPRDRASARERRPQWTRLRRGAQRALSAGREAARELAVAAGELAVTLLTRAIAFAHEWWPRLHYHARHARRRWLTLESTTGQVIAATAASVAVALLIVTLL